MSTKLDADQVLKESFDEPNKRLRVDAEVTAVIGDVEVSIDQASDSIRIGDGTDLVTATPVDSRVGLDVINLGQIVPFGFDEIAVTYPLVTREVYTYKDTGSTIATVTVDYTDATKNVVTNIKRT